MLALRRPIPPLSVARSFFIFPRPSGRSSRWIEGARTSLRPLSLDGLSVTPVPFLAPPRPISYGSWGYWVAPSLGRALDRPLCGVAVRRAARSLPGAGGSRGRPLGAPARRWSGVCRLRAWAGHDQRAGESSIGRRACVAAMAAADLVVANSTWAARRCEAIAGRSSAGAGRAPGSGRAVPVAAPAERSGAHGHGGAPGRAQAPRGRAAGAVAALDPVRRPEYLVIGDGPCREPWSGLAVRAGRSPIASDSSVSCQIPRRWRERRRATCS